jgi:hypothetical protein
MPHASEKQGYQVAIWGGGIVAFAATFVVRSDHVSPLAFWIGVIGIPFGLLVSLFGLIYARKAGEKAEKQAEGRELVTCVGPVCGGRQLSKSDAKKLGDGWYCSRCLEALQELGE